MEMIYFNKKKRVSILYNDQIFIQSWFRFSKRIMRCDTNSGKYVQTIALILREFTNNKKKKRKRNKM